MQTIYGTNDSVASVDVKNARDKRTLSAVPEKAISAFLPKNYDKNKLKTEINCPQQVEAPVKKGDVLGTVSVNYDGLDLGSTNLIAAEDIESDISPIGKFVRENLTVIIVIAAAVLVIALLIILVTVHSSRKRRKAREGRGSRYRD